MSSPPHYKVYALKYGTRPGKRSETFMGGDPHDGPMPMDYFIWAIVGDGKTIVVDTGFGGQVAEKRGRTLERCPVETLALLNIDPAEVKDVIITHLHYDHAGNYDKFPNARFHLQEAELNYATGRYMQYPRLSDSFEVENVCDMVRLNYARRIVFYDDDAEIAPGIKVYRAGGHSAGLQFVSVTTQRGTLVLASDVTHYYENLETLRPFSRAFHVGDMLDGFQKLLSVSGGHIDLIIPGHDPRILAFYPPDVPEQEGIIMRLDVVPRFSTGSGMGEQSAINRE